MVLVELDSLEELNSLEKLDSMEDLNRMGINEFSQLHSKLAVCLKLVIDAMAANPTVHHFAPSKIPLLFHVG